MPTLHQLILTALSSAKAPMSRYEIMLKVNEIVSLVESPYSPGAVYHAVKSLRDSDLIEINHDYVSLKPSGDASLRDALLSPLANSSVVTILYRTLCLDQIPDAEIQANGKKLLQVHMINFSHSSSNQAHLLAGEIMMLKYCRAELSESLQRIILKIGA